MYKFDWNTKVYWISEANYDTITIEFGALLSELIEGDISCHDIARLIRGLETDGENVGVMEGSAYIAVLHSPKWEEPTPC